MNIFELTTVFIVSAFSVAYLFYQARMDAATGYVDAQLNFWIVLLSSAMALATGLFKGIPYSAPMDALMISAGLLLAVRETKRGPIMQVGDAKAIWSLYLLGCCSFGFSSSLYIVCATVVIANLSYIAWAKKKKLKGRGPYFPFLFIGHSITSTVALALTLF